MRQMEKVEAKEKIIGREVASLSILGFGIMTLIMITIMMNFDFDDDGNLFKTWESS